MGGTTDPASELSQKFNISTYLLIGERLPLFRGVTRASHLSQSSPCGQNTQPSGRVAGALVEDSARPASEISMSRVSSV